MSKWEGDGPKIDPTLQSIENAFRRMNGLIQELQDGHNKLVRLCADIEATQSELIRRTEILRACNDHNADIIADRTAHGGAVARFDDDQTKRAVQVPLDTGITPIKTDTHGVATYLPPNKEDS